MSISKRTGLVIVLVGIFAVGLILLGHATTTPQPRLISLGTTNVAAQGIVGVFVLENPLEEPALLGAFFQRAGASGTMPRPGDVGVSITLGSEALPHTTNIFLAPLPTSSGSYRLVLHFIPEGVLPPKCKRSLGMRLAGLFSRLPASLRMQPWSQRAISYSNGIRVLRSQYFQIPAQPVAPAAAGEGCP